MILGNAEGGMSRDSNLKQLRVRYLHIVKM